MASMKRPTSSLHLADNGIARLAQLKKIKHDLTGHVSRKADALNNGLISLIADVLNDVKQSSIRHEDELIYTQTAQVLAVVAHGE